MTLSDVSIKNPVFAWMLMFGLILFGIVCFLRLGVSQMPDVDFPVVNVSVSLPNASPQIMESDVADPVEDAVLGVEGVQDVQTTCTEGSANISIQLDISRDVNVAVQDVQTAVFQVERHLPKNIYPPIIRKFNNNSSPIMWLAVSADPPLTLKDLMLYVRDQLKDRFTNVDGVANVFLGGFVDRQVNIWADINKLNARQLTADDLVNTIQKQHAEVPAGFMETPKTQYDIRSMGEAYSIKDFGDLPILQRGGAPNYAPTKLKDVAAIEDGLATISRISRFNGIPSCGMGIVMQDGYNAVQVGDAVKDRVAQILPNLPKGYHVALNFDTTTFIKDNVFELELTILLAALLTALVCYLFLGSWSSTLNVFLAIPTSLFGTFIVIYFFGFTLNTFTLLALSLSIGVVVDDAIMVLENIVRHQEKGENMVDAALKGAREVTFAAVATSVAIVAIFLPLVFMQGVIGKFMLQFGVTLSGAVMISLLEAVTLTPMRCSQFVHAADETRGFAGYVAHKFEKLSAFYSRALAWCLDRRWWVVLGALVFFAASMFMAKLVKKEQVPSTDQSAFLINYQLPVDYSIFHTDEVIKQCEAVLKDRKEIQNLYTAVGGFGGNAANSAIMFVTMKPQGNRPKADWSEKIPSTGPLSLLTNFFDRHFTTPHLTQQEFMAVVRKSLKKVSPDLQVFLIDLSKRGLSRGKGYDVEFTVTGPDWADLAKYSEEIKKRMKDSPLLADVNNNYLAGQPEIQIIPDRAKAALRGVDISDLGTVLGTLIGGYTFQSAYYHESGHQNNIFIRVPQDQRLNPSDLRKVYTRNNRGELVPILDVADMKQVDSLQQITRDNRQRAIYFQANHSTTATGQQALDEALKIAKSVLPPGYQTALTGTSQEGSNTGKQLMVAMVLGIIVAYMVLASQFNSFIHPFVILLALPFSITGAFGTLWLFNQSMNMYSLIGLFLLLGLVKKNSIMLVDFTNQARERGMAVKDALLYACPVRLRPILMTSFATVAGALPAALALGPGAELRQPMAVAIIGGILISTLLTLVVVPCAYSLFAGLESKRRHLAFTVDAEGNVATVPGKKTKARSR
ncbi:MAG TPA: efflux RND transporter permease subunit [bacterium]|nr:efflux RND transporter permease subunit [bacterium]